MDQRSFTLSCRAARRSRCRRGDGGDRCGTGGPLRPAVLQPLHHARSRQIRIGRLNETRSAAFNRIGCDRRPAENREGLRESGPGHSSQITMRFTVGLILLAIAVAASAQEAVHPSEPEGSFLTVNGKRIWYRTEGQGAPLLLIPGGPGASHTYLWPYLSPLSKEFKVIYYDPYGR